MTEPTTDIAIGQRVRVIEEHWLSDLRKGEVGIVVKVMPPGRFNDQWGYKIKGKDDWTTVLTREMFEPIVDDVRAALAQGGDQ